MVGYECYVDGLDPTARLILSIILLAIIMPLVVFMFEHMGPIATNCLKEGRIGLFCLNIFFIGVACLMLFVVVANLVFAILCMVG